MISPISTESCEFRVHFVVITMHGLSLFLRCVFVLALLLGMPLLALPPVTAWIEETWNTAAIGRTEANLDSSETVLDEIEPAGHDRKSFLRLTAASHDKLAQSSMAKERFREIHQELADLGAVYTRLESTANQPTQFQFECHIPVTNSVYARTFQHTSTEPLVAMQQVLLDVRSWRRSRLHQAMRASQDLR